MFEKKLLVNRYIELYNPFSRIIDSFPQIGNRYFELANPSSQIAIHSLESDYPFSRSAIIEIEGTNSNSRERIIS